MAYDEQTLRNMRKEQAATYDVKRYFTESAGADVATVYHVVFYEEARGHCIAIVDGKRFDVSFYRDKSDGTYRPSDIVAEKVLY